MYLEPELDAALERVADQRGTSKAEIIRESLRRAVSEVPPPRASVGIFEGPPEGDVSESVDQYLEKTGFGG